MNTMLWILQVCLAVVFIVPGFGKIASSKQQHIADGHIKPDGSIVPIRILGILEWLGCIGIILPWLSGISPVLTPIAASGFSAIMVGGLIVHIQKKEYKMLPLLLTILLVSTFVAYFRFRQLSN